MRAKRNDGSVSRRGDELGADLPADPYRDRAKAPSPAVCPDCLACYQRGRWTWATPDPRATERVCPACRRIRERQPAGYLSIGGPFAAAHRGEVERLLRNEEAAEKREHPLQRIMQVDHTEAGLQITTTDVHMARRLGEALERAFQGVLEMKQTPGEYLVRVTWQR